MTIGNTHSVIYMTRAVFKKALSSYMYMSVVGPCLVTFFFFFSIHWSISLPLQFCYISRNMTEGETNGDFTICRGR